jgi:hypothetical protein
MLGLFFYLMALKNVWPLAKDLIDKHLFGG